MVNFVARRLLSAVPVALGVALGAFLIIHLSPGDPVVQMLGFQATEANVKQVREQLGLDGSLPSQYIRFVSDLSTGDLGTSIIRDAPVSSIIEGRVAPSALLIGYSVTLALLAAVPLALVAALHRNRAADHLIRLGSTIGFAMPAFWLGLLLALVFSVHLGWFPVSGYEPGFPEAIRSLTLPAVTIALFLSPLVLRLLRASLIEVLRDDFVDALRARGLPERRVIGTHVMQNSLLSTVTITAVSIGYLLGGTVVVENVFQIPGLGSLLVQAILDRDYPTVQALVFIFGITIVLINLVADVIYAAVDPRVRLSR
jgi:ABC-type dipeptide/oligopeptide/nickel transport system permease component